MVYPECVSAFNYPTGREHILGFEHCLGRRESTAQIQHQNMAFTPSAWRTDVRVILRQYDLDIKETSFIDAALRPWYSPCPDVDVLLGRCELHSTQILFLDVRYFAVDPLHCRLWQGAGRLALCSSAFGLEWA